jgi:hypothetical protein
MPVAATGMVRVAMGNHRTVHGLVWIDVEIAGRAIEPLRFRAEPRFELGCHVPDTFDRPGRFRKGLPLATRNGMFGITNEMYDE